MAEEVIMSSWREGSNWCSTGERLSQVVLSEREKAICRDERGKNELVTEIERSHREKPYQTTVLIRLPIKLSNCSKRIEAHPLLSKAPERSEIHPKKRELQTHWQGPTFFRKP